MQPAAARQGVVARAVPAAERVGAAAGRVLPVAPLEHRLLLEFWEIFIQICDLLWKTYMKVAIFS